MLGWLTRVVVGSGDKEIKGLFPLVERVNELEASFEALSDVELRDKTTAFRGRVLAGESLDDLLPEAFAAVREAAKRALGQRPYDVQVLAGIVLHQGKIAEMKTGEGKTLVATMPLYLNALTGRGCHLVTPNDYLSRVGGGWMGPVHYALGISVGVIARDFAAVYDPEYDDPHPHGDPRLDHWRPVSRREAYLADITYGENSEFGFDYLRDNMATSLAELVQRDLYYAIVDEVDNILVDEARTPLIISGPAEESTDQYYRFAQIVERLREGEDYTVDHRLRAATLTDDGIAKVERLAKVDNIYGEDNFHLVHYLEQALKANVIFKRDRDYVLVLDGKVLDAPARHPEAEIVIVDEFTGRLQFGRRYSEGLHQAIEARERVRVRQQNVTYASITYQNYFRLHEKLAGMTGTAKTEEDEFRKIYDLDVIVVPTHRPMIREEWSDLVHKSELAKYEAVVDEIEEMIELGRPVLVGTTSVEKSERLSTMLSRRGIKHEVLNAKHHEREALIVAQAGRRRAVTIATNMAGRGTDIILGGNPPNPIEADAVRRAGGLHILGTERHEARRIDNQLRGRAGRQGDPGSSRFYLSLEDELMRRFGSERIAGIMERLGLEDDQPIEHGLVTKSIETAQQKVEGYNFDLRKHTLEYDDVMNKQREVIYGQRRRILETEDVRPLVQTIIHNELEKLVKLYAAGSPDVWDLEALHQAVRGVLGPELTHEAAELEGLGRDELVAAAQEWSDELWAAREAQVGQDPLNAAIRFVMLRVMDSLWVEHLTAIDDIIAGIGLRAYGQRDPLIEYKNEAYRMFQELLANTQHNIAAAVNHLTFVPQPAATANGPALAPAATGLARAQPRPQGLRANRDDERSPQPARAGKKVGRNDPCPCGSGKKYKKCCGR